VAVSRDVERDLRVVDELQDPFIRRSLKAALHFRRYLGLYAFLAIWALGLAIFPSVQGGDDDDSGAPVAVGQGIPEAGGKIKTAGDGAATDITGSTSGDGGGGRTAGEAGTGTGSTPAAAQTIADSLPQAMNQTGTTRGGVACRPGVGQLPTSQYSAPCTAAFTGNNGGATSFGVTPKTIRIVRRGFPDSANSRAVDAVVEQAGGVSDEVADGIRDVFIEHFDKMFEHYGRKIEWIDYESKYGNSTDEALSKGREGACADATYIKKELNAFAVAPGPNAATVSAVFAECAAQRGMVTFASAAYYPETWYRQFHPYAWGGVMECERISHQLAEYIGKRLLNRKAKWAGDPLMQRRTRHFGTYIPDNDQYQRCGKLTQAELSSKYGNKAKGEQYNYALDVSRFPDQAAQAIVQFKAAGVTTIVLACDPISTIFLTQSASRQRYYPEWLNIGVALNDVDNAARLFDQEAVRGHLFGMSQLGSTIKLIGPESEPWKLYKQLTGKDLPGATDGRYWGLIGMYNALQGAGPLLNPESMAEGIFRAPPGGAPDYAVGYISFQDGPAGEVGGRDHTGIDDSREIYWVGTKKSDSDGEEGTYVETYGGKRFRNGDWPREEPPIYP
jgi:hypothetical protein